MRYRRAHFYDAEAHRGCYPYDDMLGVSDGMSEGMKRLVVKLCTRLPYAEAAAVFTELTQVAVSASHAWTLTQEVGQQARPALEPKPTLKETSDTAECVAISMDGCMVNVRGEGWKEIKAGVISEVERSDTVSCNRHHELVQHVHLCAHSYVLHLGGPEGFGVKLAVEAQARRWSHGQQSVVVADGAPWIWNLANHDYPCAAHVVDWYHAKQHLHTAAELLFGADVGNVANIELWVEDTANVLYEGHTLDIVQRLELAAAAVSATKPELKGKLKAEACYFASNYERMQYRDFQRAHLPIGSGAVESGAKQTKHRVAAAGMRWSRQGLENLLPLRAATMSGTFDTFWTAIRPH